MTELASFKSHHLAVHSVRYSANGTNCYTCGADMKVKLWNLKRQQLLCTYRGHNRDVLNLAVSYNGKQIASCGADKSIIFWDVTTGRPLRRHRGHKNNVTCVSFNDETSMTISGSEDMTVAFWDILGHRQKPVQVIKDAKDAITSVTVSGFEILTCSVDCYVRLYDIRMGMMTSDNIGHVITFGNVTFDQHCYVLSCADNCIRLYDKVTGDHSNTFVGHESRNFMLENAINEEDDLIMSGSAKGDVLFWDAMTGDLLKKVIHKKNKPVISLSQHPTDKCLLTACEDEIKVWDTSAVEH